MPTVRTTVVSPVSSSTHPRSLTIVVDYIYDNGTALPAYLFVRCKESATEAAVYMTTIEQSVDTTQTTVVMHQADKSDVEVEARIVSTTSWDGTCLCSSVADDITLKDPAAVPIGFPPPGGLTKEREAARSLSGFLSAAEQDALFPPRAADSEFKQDVRVANFDPDKDVVLFTLHGHELFKPRAQSLRMIRRKFHRQLLDGEVVYDKVKNLFTVSVKSDPKRNDRTLVVTHYDKNREHVATSSLALGAAATDTAKPAVQRRNRRSR